MKNKILLAVFAVAAILFTVTVLKNRVPDGARRIPVRGEEAAAVGREAIALIREAKNSSPESFICRCTNPNDSELGMFYRALRQLELASEEPLAVEAFYDRPEQFNVFLALAEKGTRGQLVLSRDPDSGGWRFERFYILP